MVTSNGRNLTVNRKSGDKPWRCISQSVCSGETDTFNKRGYIGRFLAAYNNFPSRQLFFQVSADLGNKSGDDKLADLYLIFMISSNHKSENFVQSKRFGVDYYLVEPFERPDLLNHLYESFPHVERTAGEIIRKIRSDLSILVADDNENDRKMINDIFSDTDFEILEAATIDDALAVIDGTRIVGAVLDVDFRESRSGLWLLKKIMKNRPEIKVIVVSGSPSSKVGDWRSEAEKLGAVAAFDKASYTDNQILSVF